MSKRPKLAFGFIIVIYCLGLLILFVPPPGEAQAENRLLYLTHSAGYKHKVLPLSEKVMKQIEIKTGYFAVDITQDPSLINAENLKKYDAVMFYTTGELPISAAQKSALLQFVRSGNGFIGTHSATDTFYEWAEYGHLIGGYFDEHPWHEEVSIIVEDSKHPSVGHLGKSFKITDEIYQFKNFSRENVRVLLSLDADSVDLSDPRVNRTDGDFPIAWCRNYGSGRVFYTGLGHREEVWQDERYQKHLVNGIRWAMGELPGSASPRPKPVLHPITP